MISWNNLDQVNAYQELSKVARVNLAEVMSGSNGAERVKKYSVSMGDGMAYNYAAKQVDDDVLAALEKLAAETQLVEKFEALYNGEVINTGEKRLVLHHMTRGQLGDAVVADDVDKRTFYIEQQKKIADLANKVHNGEITNAAGERFTTVVQIGIGGSDLGPRAMYLALENWAKVNNCFKMEAKFISNVDPDDAAAVLHDIDVAHTLFVLVSKSGTTLETLTNESFVKDALKNAGKSVFTRSVYLQGLVFMNPENLPEKMAFVKPTLEKYQKLCKEFEVSPAVLALSYVLSVPAVTSVVLGCQTPEQVVSNCEMINSRLELTASHMEALHKAFADTPRRVLDPRIW